MPVVIDDDPRRAIDDGDSYSCYRGKCGEGGTAGSAPSYVYDGTAGREVGLRACPQAPQVDVLHQLNQGFGPAELLRR